MAVTTDGQPDYVEPVILDPRQQFRSRRVAKPIGQPAFAPENIIDHDSAQAVLFTGHRGEQRAACGVARSANNGLAGRDLVHDLLQAPQPHGHFDKVAPVAFPILAQQTGSGSEQINQNRFERHAARNHRFDMRQHFVGFDLHHQRGKRLDLECVDRSIFVGCIGNRQSGRVRNHHPGDNLAFDKRSQRSRVFAIDMPAKCRQADGLCSRAPVDQIAVTSGTVVQIPVHRCHHRFSPPNRHIHLVRRTWFAWSRDSQRMPLDPNWQPSTAGPAQKVSNNLDVNFD